MTVINPEVVYQPRAVGDEVAITALTAENPTRATVSEADGLKLADGDTLMLAFSDPLTSMDGSLGIVSNLQLTEFQLEGVDLSAVDTTDVTATGTVTDTVPIPPDPPSQPGGPPGSADWVASPTPPPIDPDNVYPSPGHAVGFYPSPGLGPVPVAPHPDAAQRMAEVSAKAQPILTAADVEHKPPQE